MNTGQQPVMKSVHYVGLVQFINILHFRTPKFCKWGCGAIIGCARVYSRVITSLAHCVRTVSCVVAAHSVQASLCEGCFLFDRT